MSLYLLMLLAYTPPAMSNARVPDPYNLCQFTFANGRLCGLPASPKYDGLCYAHGRRANSPPPAPREFDLSPEFTSPTGEFITQIDINHVLGKLFVALAANRISTRRAGTLAYIAGLLAQTQSGAKREALRWDLDYDTLLKLYHLKYGKVPAPGSPPGPSAVHPPAASSSPDPAKASR